MCFLESTSPAQLKLFAQILHYSIINANTFNKKFDPVKIASALSGLDLVRSITQMYLFVYI